MDLFVVNRFTGTNSAEIKTEEENKLSNVLNKISKRKKRKLEAQSQLPKESELFKSVDETQVTPEEQIKSTLTNVPAETNEFDLDEPETKKAKTFDPSNIEGFTILGTEKFDERQTVKRVLPKWLRNPTVISTDLQNLDEKLSHAELSKKLKTKLKENKIKYLFPVQAGFIPWQLRKSKEAKVIHPPDVCVSAPTGSGKTLAFAIPILQYLIDKLENRNITVKAVRALVVLPTQSLAVQVYDTFKSYSAGTGITVGIITSAETTFKNEQKLMVVNNSVWGSTSRSDIIICTAGRLIDHIKNTNGFELKYLEFVIMDEADRVIDSMQDDWFRHLDMFLRCEGENFTGHNIFTLASSKKRTDPQKLLFSATLSSDPEKLDKLSLFQPKLFTCIPSKEEATSENTERFIGKYTVPNELEEKYIITSLARKPLVLYRLILETVQSTESAKIIVFVNEVNTGHRLSMLLCLMARKAFTVNEISNDTPKNLKKELLNSFSSGKTNVLICTNQMARGMDVPNVDCVVSYSAPTHIKTYVHRAGRTARCGLRGVCITMLESHEKGKFLRMLEDAGTNRNIEEIQFNENELQALSSRYQKSLEKLKVKVSSHKRNVVLKTLLGKRVFGSKIKRRGKKLIV